MTWHPDMPLEYRNAIVTGDARELAQRIPDESVDLIFTDPVYQNIDDYRWLAETAARVLRPGAALLVFAGLCYLKDAISATEVMVWRGLLTWHLGGTPHKRYGKTIDNGCYVIWLGGWPINYTPLVWDSQPWGYESDFHWQKSRRLIARHVEDFTHPSAIVYDPFTGGGTVPAVCKMLGRNYVASEIDPDTAERARQRVLTTQPPLFVLEPEQVEMQL